MLGNRACADLGAERLGLEAEADLRPDLPAQRLEVDVVRGTGDCGMQGLVCRPGRLAVGSFDVFGEGALDRRDVVGRPALRGSAGDQRFEDVFEVDVTLRAGGQNTIADPTLLDALNATGGGVNALARHAVAALLNASNPDVESDFTAAEVIALVQDAIAPGGITIEQAHQLLAAANEQGCPLN